MFIILVYYKHYNADIVHQRYNTGFCCSNKISNWLNLPVVILNDKKLQNTSGFSYMHFEKRVCYYKLHVRLWKFPNDIVMVS